MAAQDVFSCKAKYVRKGRKRRRNMPLSLSLSLWALARKFGQRSFFFFEARCFQLPVWRGEVVELGVYLEQ